jgi:sulfur dioxygenase
MLIRQLFDAQSSTYTYLIADPAAKVAALIDPVAEQAPRDLALLRELDYRLVYVLETHVHADHVTAASRLREATGARTVASALGAPCADVHVAHGDRLRLGSVEVEVLATPGHTDDSLSYRIGADVFTGDALLVRSAGRTDFQHGDAGQLYDSITGVLFALPDDTRVWPGHDYRGFTVSTIGEEKRHNQRIAGKSRADFITLMAGLALPPPKRIQEAVPANRACGEAPPPLTPR